MNDLDDTQVIPIPHDMVLSREQAEISFPSSGTAKTIKEKLEPTQLIEHLKPPYLADESTQHVTDTQSEFFVNQPPQSSGTSEEPSGSPHETTDIDLMSPRVAPETHQDNTPSLSVAFKQADDTLEFNETPFLNKITDPFADTPQAEDKLLETPFFRKHSDIFLETPTNNKNTRKSNVRNIFADLRKQAFNEEGFDYESQEPDVIFAGAATQKISDTATQRLATDDETQKIVYSQDSEPLFPILTPPDAPTVEIKQTQDGLSPFVKVVPGPKIDEIVSDDEDPHMSNENSNELDDSVKGLELQDTLPIYAALARHTELQDTVPMDVFPIVRDELQTAAPVLVKETEQGSLPIETGSPRHGDPQKDLQDIDMPDAEQDTAPIKSSWTKGSDLHNPAVEDPNFSVYINPTGDSGNTTKSPLRSKPLVSDFLPARSPPSIRAIPRMYPPKGPIAHAATQSSPGFIAESSPSIRDKSDMLTLRAFTEKFPKLAFQNVNQPPPVQLPSSPDQYNSLRELSEEMFITVDPNPVNVDADFTQEIDEEEPHKQFLLLDKITGKTSPIKEKSAASPPNSETGEDEDSAIGTRSRRRKLVRDLSQELSDKIPPESCLGSTWKTVGRGRYNPPESSSPTRKKTKGDVLPPDKALRKDETTSHENYCVTLSLKDKSDANHDTDYPTTTVTKEAKRKLSGKDCKFKRSVWARYGTDIYPGIINYENLTSTHVNVKFGDGDSNVSRDDIFLLDIKVGDKVKLLGDEASTWAVTGLTCNNHYPSTIRCMRGFDFVVLKKVKGGRAAKTAEEEEVDLRDIYITLNQWKARRKLPHTFNILPVKPEETASPFASPKRNHSLGGESPVLQSLRSKHIFSGCVFCITSTKKSDTSRVESSIQRYGGTILSSFEEGLILDRTALELCLTSKFLNLYHFGAVISDGHCRTPKYIQALALGWPVLSAEFVSDCIRDYAIVSDWPSYMWAAGFSKVLQGVLSHDTSNFREIQKAQLDLSHQLRNRSHVLQNFRVLAVSDTTISPTICEFVVHALGARSLGNFSNYYDAAKACKALNLTDSCKFLVYECDKKTRDIAREFEDAMFSREIKRPKTETSVLFRGFSKKSKLPVRPSTVDAEVEGAGANYITDYDKYQFQGVNWEWMVQCVISGHAWPGNKAEAIDEV
ncbi:hypothetical protein BABINDRAFT_7631 [Babjeviella inositovora NRRL Y-12698]|uniref:BRCT domain-containing protein n=1 Tax=Babjeviella inositovora NRRL Y-12698 TaxID=984486 RepID=A0A1E3QR29_9ASCO|nr:uncharacterized protein BABINDRAFT_7631 [Babjeviella inositovora NRRL Y-12698]ODQ80153.1 hypothetical protein BABINDRAFT_7631 [Babjeviella inositovora NRRL Y-12698]